MLNLVFLIPLLPLTGFLILGSLNNRLPKTIVSFVGCGTVLGSFVIVLTLLSGTLSGTITSATISYFDWIYAGDLNLKMSFLIDPLSVLMMTIITGVGFLIHVYSAGYMHEDSGFVRYFAFLNLFVFSMLLLVMGSNYVVMFAGWEGVGLCSYLLIGFWFKKDAYNDAAQKAFVMNRIGDLGFLLGMILIFTTFGSLDYDDVFKNATSVLTENSGVAIAITLLLFIGATGKSAQIPLYTWLPDAMAGPTPVSALIHAATMVTAGIYMVVRSNILYSLAPFTLDVILAIGLATALFAASMGLFQNDIKKVLAYSTVSQLGYMFFALGLGAFSAGMFHVTTHAFFKALLFLGAGSVIHALHHEQDIRNMGGLSKKLPITFLTFLTATLAIAGIPPFAGFFSKDEILAAAYERSPVLWALGLAGALMTTFYMFRLLFVTFFGTFRGTDEQKHHLHESPLVMTIPLMVLALLSIIGGFIGVPEVLGGSNFLKNFLSSVIIPYGEKHEHLSHSTEWILMTTSTLAVIATIIMAYVIFVVKKSVPAEDNKISGLQKLIYNKYYVDEIYDTLFSKPVTFLSKIFHSVVESKIVDATVNAVGKAVSASSKILRLSQSGNISYYLYVMVIGIILILFINNIL
ncbi:MAG: NADH-quinone oxidoreductase subunit L [Cytophagaceae bacterium]|nr:NADH-quinone oxidoreductase subunit L [Cytophagaceae bacterium]MDW8455972.1 NADH-quinone oxidoreductase subunit L [Cytophagaceae bacterium]